jgi:hypothetical protein
MKRAASFRSLLFVILVGSLFPTCFAGEKILDNDPHVYRSGVRFTLGKHRLHEKHLSQVVESLRQKTGLQELNFDMDGFLRIGDQAKIEGGSPTARELIFKAIETSAQLILENHSHSSKVAFANLGKSTLFINMRTKKQIEHRSLRLDFSDFKKLIGPKEVIASFDLGMAILHELVHGVLRLPDEVNEWEELGACERYVNTIRKELNLPERQHYVARSRSIQSPVGWTVQLAELQFARTNFKNGTLKTDEYKLNWDIKNVGLGERENVKSIPNSVASKNSERKSTAAVH